MNQVLNWKNSSKKSHFYPAFLFLSNEERHGLQILYAVCRMLDDAVDVGHENPREFLGCWRQFFIDENPRPLGDFGAYELADEFLKVRRKFSVPMFAMVDLIDRGLLKDLDNKCFQTPQELEDYCYGVAGTVGVACLPLFGVPVEEAKTYAIRLGIAVQWVNIIRDVGVDAREGRIYLPLDHMEQFGYTKEDIFANRASSEFIKLLDFEYGVALSHFKSACDLLPLGWKRRLKPARVMGSIYAALLEKIRKKRFGVFKEKIRLNWMEQVHAVIFS